MDRLAEYIQFLPLSLSQPVVHAHKLGMSVRMESAVRRYVVQSVREVVIPLSQLSVCGLQGEVEVMW